MIASIQAHFGFTRMPFGKDVAPDALHQHKAHAEAVARISWCIAEGALGLVTGEVGSGKTAAVRAATSMLDPRAHHVIYLGCPAVGARGIYAAIVAALGKKPRFHNASLIPQAQAALAGELDERGRRVVLVCDESHLMSTEQLEELRMLTNDNASMDSRSTMACLLIGQPSLRRRVKLGMFAALDQRIALRCVMAPMEPAETGSYISHHLGLAGRADRIFSDDAVALIHQVSRGLPRAVNNPGARRHLRPGQGHRG
jgi:type II secretory pathway predicted ATPase ExeA